MKESENLELKKSLASMDEIIQTIAAFQNTEGGQVIIGVDEHGRPTGVDIGKNTLENLAREISDNTSPKIHPRIREEKMNERTIIRIIVEEGNHKPYFCKGTAYKRVGRSNLKMDSQAIEDAIMQRRAVDLSFDSAYCEPARLEDIDTDKIREFLVLSNKMRKSQYALIDVRSTLASLGLMAGSRITNCAILLFGKNPQKFFPQSATRCGVLKGNDLIDLKLVEGAYVNMVEETFKFVISHIRKTISIEGARRIERYEYPEGAIREAIINAMTHRDFDNPSSVYVSLYEDRVEIKNPGLMPNGIKLADLKKEGHPSLPRNKILAKMAYLAGYIEQYGIGTTKITRLCRERGLKEPVFSEEMGFFKVTLYNQGPEISARQRRALEIIRRGKQISAREYARKFRITDRYARKELSELEGMGFVSKKREGKAVFYHTGTM